MEKNSTWIISIFSLVISIIAICVSINLAGKYSTLVEPDLELYFKTTFANYEDKIYPRFIASRIVKDGYVGDDATLCVLNTGQKPPGRVEVKMISNWTLEQDYSFINNNSIGGVMDEMCLTEHLIQKDCLNHGNGILEKCDIEKLPDNPAVILLEVLCERCPKTKWTEVVRIFIDK